VTEWKNGMEETIDGIEFRVSRGTKFPDDLVLWARGTDGRWRMVHMDLAFFLVDFLADNEDRRTPHVSFWKVNGQKFFMTACWDAARNGWQAAAAKLARQRDAVA
jgi:hypothetical protein